jgi:hypothetical protein
VSDFTSRKDVLAKFDVSPEISIRWRADRGDQHQDQEAHGGKKERRRSRIPHIVEWRGGHQTAD